jgi:hypothetical protein
MMEDKVLQVALWRRTQKRAVGQRGILLGSGQLYI